MTVTNGDISMSRIYECLQLLAPFYWVYRLDKLFNLLTFIFFATFVSLHCVLFCKNSQSIKLHSSFLTPYTDLS